MSTAKMLKKVFCVLLCLCAAMQFSAVCAAAQTGEAQPYYLGTPEIRVTQADGCTVTQLTVSFNVALREPDDGAVPILTQYDASIPVEITVLALQTPVAQYKAHISAYDPFTGTVVLDVFDPDGKPGAAMVCLGMINPYAYALDGTKEMLPTGALFGYRFSFPEGLLFGANAVSAALERELDVRDLPIYEDSLVSERLVTGSIDFINKFSRSDRVDNLRQRMLRQIGERLDRLIAMNDRNPFKWAGLFFYGLPTVAVALPVLIHLFVVLHGALGLFGANLQVLRS